jgi:hypothetical protein
LTVDAEVILPPGVERGSLRGTGRALVDNRTDLPNDVVEQAIESHFIENARGLGGTPDSFSTFSHEGGGMLARPKFKAPSNVIEEIELARDLADRDDDVAAALDFMVAAAFGEGMENFHEEERTVAMFNEVAKNANLDLVLKTMYREYLISQQVNTVSLFTRKQVEFRPEGTGRLFRENLAVPLVGVIDAENIRVIDNDIFGTGRLAYDCRENDKLRRWLDEYFDKSTSPAARAKLAREDRLAATMFTGIYEVPWDSDDRTIRGTRLYILNPRMVHRMTAPKGAKRYPRPLLTRNFSLIEAKRLLSLMDFALLNGGMNYLVVAKQGSEKQPGRQPEIDSLADTIRRASRTGVIVGDHRLTLDIITPDLDEMLSPGRRAMLGRKIAQSLLRVPEAPADSGVEAMKAALEMTARTITSDRHAIKRHVEGRIYDETAERNRIFRRGPAKLWFPRIVLQDNNYFTDYVIKLRDRGDIPRKWAVEAAGFDYEAALHQRERELERGDDDTLLPAAVPFSDGNPQDNNDGRPRGGSPDNGRPGARPGNGRDPAEPRRRTLTRNQGETVRAIWDDALDRTVRVGESTYAILEQFPDREIGRVTAHERAVLESDEVGAVQLGPAVVVKVNPGYEVPELRAVRLAKGMSMLCGQRRDGALVAKALVFREDAFTPADAEARALEWGFDLPALPAPAPSE